MKRNINLFAFGLAMLLNLGFLNHVIAQMVQELQELEPTETTEEKPIKQWQLSLDLSPTVLALVGGQRPEYFPFGLQAKRLYGKNGIRFFAQLYPNSNWTNGQVSTREVQNATLNTMYLIAFDNSFLTQAGFGYERGKKARWGRKYFGVDWSFLYEQTTRTAFLSNVDPSKGHDWMDGLGNAKSKQMNSYGIGIAPFIGYEFQAGKHWGFNLEVRPEIALTTGRYILVDDNANFQRAGYFYFFKTFPLLDFRLHYRF